MAVTDIFTVTDLILNGTSLAAGVKTDWSHVLSLGMPAAWTAAVITMQVSQDGITYRNLFDEFGSEVTLTVAAGNEVALPVTRLAPYGWVKLRSGTAAAPVAQGANSLFTFVMRRYQ